MFDSQIVEEREAIEGFVQHSIYEKEDGRK